MIPPVPCHAVHISSAQGASGSKLRNLIIHHVKKYVLAHCMKLQAIYSHSCLPYS